MTHENDGKRTNELYRIVSKEIGYALFQGPRRVADLYGFYADCKSIEQQLNRAVAVDELLKTSREVRDALLAFGKTVISDDLDLDPQVYEAMKLLWPHEAKLDAAITAAEGGQRADAPQE